MRDGLPLRYANESFILTRPHCEFALILNSLSTGPRLECEGVLVVTTHRLIMINNAKNEPWTAVSLLYDLMRD